MKTLTPNGYLPYGKGQTIKKRPLPPSPKNLKGIPPDHVYVGGGPFMYMEGAEDGELDSAFGGMSAVHRAWAPAWLGPRGDSIHRTLPKNSPILAEYFDLSTLPSTTPTPKIKTMKLTLKTLPSTEIQLPSNHIAFQITEQVGFDCARPFISNGIQFQSSSEPCVEINDSGSGTFWLRGLTKSQDNKILVTTNTIYSKITFALAELLKKENAPKPPPVLYTATFFYRNEGNGSKKRRMVQVIKDDPVYLEGNDVDDGGPYKKFLKTNILGSVDKIVK